jgi:hypothetical protein
VAPRPKHERRTKTVGGIFTKAEAKAGVKLLDGTDGHHRPRTRADCIDGPRPCPWVGCKHNLYCDVTEFGGLALSWPDLEPWEMVRSCALDVARSGDEMTLEDVATTINMTRERIRQIERDAINRLRADEYLEDAGSANPGDPIHYEARKIDDERELIGTRAVLELLKLTKDALYGRYIRTKRLRPVIPGRGGRNGNEAQFDAIAVRELVAELEG